MNISASKFLVGVALVFFLIATILSVILGPGLANPITWIAAGLAAWALGALVS